MTVLDIDRAGRVYGSGHLRVVALHDVSLRVGAGEFVAIMGPSGSGKSTLLRLAGGLDRPTSGRVLLAGSDLAGLDESDLAKARRREVGFVFQDANLLVSLTAAENVALALELDGIKPKAAMAGARGLLDSLDLTAIAGRFPGQLSGGEQQRVAIARAVAGGRSLLLADEPTGALDALTGESVMGLLRQRCTTGCAVVLVTHNVRHAAWADRVVFLNDGRLAGEAGPAAGPECLLGTGGYGDWPGRPSHHRAGWRGEGLPPGREQGKRGRRREHRAGGSAKADGGRRVGFRALNGVDLTITKGEMVAVTGPSGSGKTTIINLIAGIDRPTAGTVTVNGRRLDQMTEEQLAVWRGHTIGIVFQFFQLMPTLTAVENATLPLDLGHVGAARDRRGVASRNLATVGLADRGDRLPLELSGGEQQRVAIARAMVCGPPVLLGDEPTGNLDTKLARDMFELLKSLNEHGTAVVYVTHDQALAAMASRIVSVRDGLIVGDTGLRQ